MQSPPATSSHYQTVVLIDPDGGSGKGQYRSGKVREGHGRPYPNTRCVDNVRKVMGGWVVVACRIIVLSPGPGF